MPAELRAFRVLGGFMGVSTEEGVKAFYRHYGKLDKSTFGEFFGLQHHACWILRRKIFKWIGWYLG
jgi:hypothetical protein